MNVFDIIGPVMVGPSSSHTAGAVRIGRFTRAFLGEEPIEAEIRLHGSFARTYKGHGTDRAIIGGLMGFDKDDLRLKDSFMYAREKGIKGKQRDGSFASLFFRVAGDESGGSFLLATYGRGQNDIIYSIKT